MTTTVHHNSETGATRVVDNANPFRWDEPAGCTSPRGWLHNDALNACVGFYLDYGPDHYRTAHVTEIGPGHWVSFCQPARKCKECQLGNVLAVRYPDGPRIDNGHGSRYVVTLEQARAYVETGAVSEQETVAT